MVSRNNCFCSITLFRGVRPHGTPGRRPNTYAARKLEDDIPEEDVDIEVAAVEVDDMLDEDEEVEEVYPKTSKLPGMMNTPKMVFMS